MYFVPGFAQMDYLYLDGVIVNLSTAVFLVLRFPIGPETLAIKPALVVDTDV